MPRSTQWFIKAGILYFLAGVVLSFLSELPVLDSLSLLPVYWHMLVMGWITQLIIGVSVWMFPRKYRDRPKRESLLVWSTFWMLNGGLILRFLSEPLVYLYPGSVALTVMIWLAALLQVAAIGCYIAEIWPRLQPRRKPQPKPSKP
jgi:hypothetical protein